MRGKAQDCKTHIEPKGIATCDESAVLIRGCVLNNIEANRRMRRNIGKREIPLADVSVV